MKSNYSLDYIIEQIKANIDVREIAEEHLNLSKTGMAHCPLHSDRKPSFSVSSKKKLFKCFSCGIGGDVVSLYAMLNNVSNGQAINQLGKRLGLSGNKQLPMRIERQYAKKKRDKSLEESFLKLYKQIFDNLCSIRDMMIDLAKQYELIEEMENDELLIRYYHDKACHEYILDQLLLGFFEEISFEQQIDVFLVAKEIVEKWARHLHSRMSC